jgi:glutamate synthase (NADPH/NADH) small chain
MVFKAIGQVFVPDPLTAGGVEPLDLADGRILVNADRRTSLPDVYAGGDCVPGLDLTVRGVEDGKVAAHAIDRALRGR